MAGRARARGCGLLGCALITAAASLGCGLFSPPPPRDDDGDGFINADDCDDNDASTNPSASERCNGRDDDCDGQVDNNATDAETSYADRDGDGFGDPAATTKACSPPPSHVTNDRDCDDVRKDVHPGATEYCDGLDNDCNGRVDDDAVDLVTWHADADGDGFGDPDSTTAACRAPDGYTANDRDCDDTRADVSPEAPEICADGADNDCLVDTPDDCAFGTHLLQTTTATLLPRGVDDQLGFSVAGVGDIDDDGYDDLLVGSPALSVLRDGGFIVRGPLTGRQDVAVAGDLLDVGEDPGQAGWSVAGGDANGDGYADIVVGAPTATEASPAPGLASLRFGPDVVDCEPYCKGATLLGEADGDRAGAATALGDVTGDGLDDVVLGAPGAATNGRVYLVQGPPTGRVLLADARAHLDGATTGGAAGSEVAVGDLNDDGRDDLVVVDLRDGDGAIYVVFGSVRGAVSLDDADARPTLDPDLGALHAATGDVSGDGVPDLVVSAERDATSPATDVVWVFTDASTGELGPADASSTVSSAQVWANGGAVVAAGGDFNRDGRGDLLVGAIRAETWLPSDDAVLFDQAGSVYALAGPIADGRVELTTATARLIAPELRDLAVMSIAFGGDLDRDGYDEIVIGARRHSGVYTNGGVVWVTSGAGL